MGMNVYKAFVTDKQNGRGVIIESECNSKKEFIHDLRRNGYAVNPDNVKKKKVFDFIINHTNCTPWEWKEINKVPEVFEPHI